jgi:hypothetical protein
LTSIHHKKWPRDGNTRGKNPNVVASGTPIQHKKEQWMATHRAKNLNAAAPGTKTQHPKKTAWMTTHQAKTKPGEGTLLGCFLTLVDDNLNVSIKNKVEYIKK